jgi:hypothetical protein
MALLMQSILVEAGHEAFCINFGDADGPISHVLVLAAVESGGCKEFAVYDPFLGLYIADEDGPASLSTIASAVKAQSVSPLRFRRIGSRYKRALVTTAYAAALGTGHRWVLPLGASRRSAISGGPEVQVDLKILAAVFGRDLQRWLVRSVKPATVFDLIRFPLGTSGEAGALALADTLSRTFTKV